jgi:hypothetical protein
MTLPGISIHLVISYQEIGRKFRTRFAEFTSLRYIRDIIHHPLLLLNVNPIHPKTENEKIQWQNQNANYLNLPAG